MEYLHILPHILNLQNNSWCPHMQWPTYFQLSIAYVDINYCFEKFKYVEGYVSIPY